MPMPKPYVHIAAARKVAEADMDSETKRFAVMDLLNKAMDALVEYKGSDHDIVHAVVCKQFGDLQRACDI